MTGLGQVTENRMHTPRWAAAPTSGAGAAAHGGRANRPGIPGLYLALEPETAVRVYQQFSPLLPPGTLVAYTVRLAPVVDFRAGRDSTRWSGLWQGFHCPLSRNKCKAKEALVVLVLAICTPNFEQMAISTEDQSFDFSKRSP